LHEENGAVDAGVGEARPQRERLVKLSTSYEKFLLRGEKKTADLDRARFLHRGIATRAFARRFQLADHVEVKRAELKNGLLDIDLVRNVPERLKSKTIAIGDGTAKVAA